MKVKLSFKESLTVTSMLFGMFFGAGNIIFPVYLGQLAGRNVWPAIIGFCITGVGFPLLAVASLGISKSNGLLELSGKVGKKYGMFFTCLLYLTIGPFFAIPRCASTSFTVGIEALLPQGTSVRVPLMIFSLVFFAAVLWFSLRPSEILTWIGKFLNPAFLFFLGVLLITALVAPLGHVKDIVPAENYTSGAFFNGFLEGYNTMDALAGLAFGIVVVNVIKNLGVNEPDNIAKSTVKSGVFSCLAMAVIYVALTVVGTQSRGFFETSANGGEALANIAMNYFGVSGLIILALMITFACLKTAIGLVTSCAETFEAMFPKGPKYKFYAVLFCIISFVFANFGLSAIIAYAIPVLMFLYPLAITLILLSLFGKFFGYDRRVYVSVTALTLVAAVFDLMKTLPGNIISALRLDVPVGFASKVLPFFDLGLGWLCPAIIGLVIGLVLHFVSKPEEA
jgi:LIVCS family branched-chain amino acid:cation transporter